MTAVVIDGREVSRASRARTAQRAQAFADQHRHAPGLATILIGNDPASEVYVRDKRRSATEAGLVDVHHHLSGDVSQETAGIPTLIGKEHLKPGAAVIDVGIHRTNSGLSATSASTKPSRSPDGLPRCPAE